MKRIFAASTIILSSLTAHAQIPVTDVASIANSQIEQVENLARWAESIAQLKIQIAQLSQQISIQSDIRQWAGNPADATSRVALDRLGVTDLLQTYGKTRDLVISAANSLAALDNTAQGTYRAIGSIDMNGDPLVRDALTHRRYSVLNSQEENYQEVFDQTKAREAELQDDLAQTLVSLKNAATDAEVRKQAAKVQAISGQLAAVGAQRRDQIDQVVAQKIANDARIEEERLAADELESKNDFLANQRVTTFMSTIKLRQNSP